MRPDQLAARLLSMFVGELEEQLRVMNDDLLQLEKTPGDAERLRSLFRSIHSLKGAARAAGVPAVEELCHAVEGELASARDGQQPLAATQLVNGFAAADALSDAARRLRLGEAIPSGEYDAIVLAIRSSGRQAEVGTVRAAPVIAPAEKEEASPPIGSAPQPVVAARAVDAEAIDEQARVSVRRIDGLIAAASELRETTAAAAAWPGEIADIRVRLAGWRTRWRRDRAATEHAIDGWLAELAADLTSLEREMNAQVRAAEATALRLVESARPLRQRPFADIAESLPRLVRDLALRLGKDVELVVAGEGIEADRTVLEALRDPLTHLVRNAIDHGIESPAERVRAGKPRTATLRIEASLRGDRLTLAVADDGRGLDIAAIRAALARAGRPVPEDEQAVARALLADQLSTRAETTEISGRGVGLDAARNAIERLGGTLDVHWIAGKGTTFTLDAPLSVATLRALLVTVAGHPVAVPTAQVERVERVNADALQVIAGERVMRGGHDAPVRFASLARLLDATPVVSADQTAQAVVVVVAAGTRLALAVDELREEREIVVRPIEHAPATRSRYVGATLLAGGEVAPVLNVPGIIGQAGDAALSGRTTAHAVRRVRLLVADDSITTRALEESVLSAAGYDVVTAPDGAEALRVIEGGGIDLLVTDVEMPRMTGLELCARVRASRDHGTLPIIIVSSLDRPEHRAQGMEAGADAYVTKSSFEQGELLALVRRLVGENE